MKGIYLLLINLSSESIIKIGSLGKLIFNKGYYVYVGSGQNNVLKRVNRHISNNKKMHWHIDYLLNNKYAKVIEAYLISGNKRRECILAKRLLKQYSSVKCFGCSDCRCGSHLFRVSKKSFIKNLRLLV